jgi:hypothetical protein
MTAITFDAAYAQKDRSKFFTLLKKLAYKQPQHYATALRKVAAPQAVVAAVSEVAVPAKPNPMLSYECDNWLRWTHN